MTNTSRKLELLSNTPPWDWPQDTAEVLLGVLRDRGSTDDERRVAAELAGESVVIDDELVSALLAILRSGEQPERVRATAAIALGPVLELCDTDGFDDPGGAPVSERTFHELQASMHALYLDAGVPEEVRRRILEASVRAPLDWHAGAIRAAYAAGDEDWKLTAVFCMQHVRGFDEQILAELDSASPAIRIEAVVAAGNWALAAAWPRVVGLVKAGDTEKQLLLAAIAAVGGIRPEEALDVLEHLEDSDDPEIEEAVAEATMLAAWETGDGDDGADDDDEDEDDDDADGDGDGDDDEDRDRR